MRIGEPKLIKNSKETADPEPAIEYIDITDIESHEEIIDKLYELHKTWQDLEKNIAEIEANINTPEQHSDDGSDLELKKQQRSKALDALMQYKDGLEGLGSFTKAQRASLYHQAVKRYESENQVKPYQSVVEKYQKNNNEDEPNAA